MPECVARLASLREKRDVLRPRAFPRLCMALMFTWIVVLAITNDLKSTQLQSRSIFIISFIALSGVFVRFSTQAGNEAMAWLFAGLVILMRSLS